MSNVKINCDYENFAREIDRDDEIDLSVEFSRDAQNTAEDLASEAEAVAETHDEFFDPTTHNGRITISNPATGGHRTFRIRTQPMESNFAPGKRVLSILDGPDNERDYQGFGFVDSFGVHVWSKKRIGDWLTFADMIENPTKWQGLGAEYMHEGTCRRCNRTLTDPESIRSGIGPICAGKE